jgi:hypothetical protein
MELDMIIASEIGSVGVGTMGGRCSERTLLDDEQTLATERARGVASVRRRASVASNTKAEAQSTSEGPTERRHRITTNPRATSVWGGMGRSCVLRIVR